MGKKAKSSTTSTLRKVAKEVSPFPGIRKRDGRTVPFDQDKITEAIFKSLRASGISDYRKAKDVSDKVIAKLRLLKFKGNIPGVEDVQDTVETALIESGYAKVAKAYILYRQKRTEIREEKQKILDKEEIDEVDKRFDINALRVLRSRYLRKSEQGAVIESPKELFTRVATHVLLPSLLYDQKVSAKNGKPFPEEKFDPIKSENKYSVGGFKLNRFHLVALKRIFDRANSSGKTRVGWSGFLKLLSEGYFDKYAPTLESFYDLMVNRQFLPNTPAIANFGNYLGMGSACFVLGINDSLDSIMDTLKSAAVIFKAGGGVGYNFSNLRPEGDFVKTTGGSASGPISFISMFDNMTDVVKQGGIRRGANMGILNINHPDIEKFITAKEGNKALRNFNISVMVMPDFWEAYEKKRPYPLVNPRNNEVVRSVNPQVLFDRLVYQAWESAEPGVLFHDRINEYNPFLKSLGPINSTNPCITGDSLVSTDRGLEKISDLRAESGLTIDNRAVRQAKTDLVKVGGKDARVLGRYDKEKTLISRGTSVGVADNVFPTGVKETHKLETKAGYEIKATADHMFLTPFGWKELRELNAGDQIYIQSGEGGWNKDDKLPVEPQNMTYGRNGRIYKKNLPASWSRELGQVLGWLTGDGWLSTKHHSLGWVFSEADLEVKDILQPTIEKWLNRPLSELETSSGVFQLRSASGPVADFFRQLGISEAGEDRVVPRAVFTATEDGVKGFIEGLFSSDGTIGIANESRRYVRLNSSSVKLLKDVQLLLLNFGIRSAIFDRSAKPKFFSYTKANGRKVRYSTSGRNYELNISRDSLRKFAGSFDFLQKEKNKKLKNLADGQEFYRDYFIEEVRSITPAGKELVWDLTENSTHSFIANGMVIKNCGEVLLYPFESCNLGSVNVWAFVKEDGERKKYYDWERLGKVVRQATRFLDNVIDINNYPMAEIENFTLSTRKVGLGVMGVGDLLYEMELPYNSERGLEFMEELMEFVNYNSKLESIELAKERGSFPLFKQSFFAEGKLPFSGYKDKSKAKRNWKEIIDAVKKHGLRNSYTTVIAPTGSISMIAGTSSGMEPVFSLVFEKNVSVGSFYYVDPVFEEQMSEMGLLDDALIKEVAAGSGSVQEVEYIPEKQKKVFVTAMNIGPRDHIKALAAFQKWVDSSISKTINFPADATVDQMKEGYLLAYKLGCKGSTVYRDSSIQNQVLVAGAKEKKKAASAKAAVETGKELRQVEDVKAEGPVIYETPGAELETEVANGIPESEITHEIKFCPKCNTELVNKEGCKTCPACGWGLCL